MNKPYLFSEDVLNEVIKNVDINSLDLDNYKVVIHKDENGELFTLLNDEHLIVFHYEKYQSDLEQWYKATNRPKLEGITHREFAKMVQGEIPKQINVLIIGRTMRQIHNVKSLDQDLIFLEKAKHVNVHHLPLNVGIGRMRGISFNFCFLLDTLDDIDFEVIMTHSQLCWVWKNRNGGWFGEQYLPHFSTRNFIFFTDDRELKKYDVSLLSFDGI